MPRSQMNGPYPSRIIVRSVKQVRKLSYHSEEHGILRIPRSIEIIEAENGIPTHSHFLRLLLMRCQ